MCIQYRCLCMNLCVYICEFMCIYVCNTVRMNVCRQVYTVNICCVGHLHVCVHYVCNESRYFFAKKIKKQ